MSRDLDTRARQASAGLKNAVEASAFTSRAPIAAPRRPLVVILRPAIIMALLVVGAAVGVALVTDSPPEATTPVPTTTPVVPTTLGAAVPVDPEPAPPTTAYVPPVSTSTVAADTIAPHLEITSPEDGAELETDAVTFEGVTEPGARVFAGKWEADVATSGEWHLLLFLSEGANTVNFTATDAAGNEAQAAITVHYVPTEPVTTTTVKELAEFTAHATFGSCAETPPYDIYYGTGQPGSMVYITSEYGSGSVEVDEEGKWEKQVFFETAPENETFVVTVKDDYGRKKHFEFIHEPA